jgi:hypothetical protein
MSHDRSWRAACIITITNPSLHFEIHFHSTRRDSCGRWLWRLVRRFAGMKRNRTSPRKTMYEPTAPWRSNAIFYRRTTPSLLSAPHAGRGRGAAISRFNIPDVFSSSGATGSTPTTGQLPYGLKRAHQAVEWPGTRLLPCADRHTASHQYSITHINFPYCLPACRTAPTKLPNVKDEPRPQPARLVL